MATACTDSSTTLKQGSALPAAAVQENTGNASFSCKVNDLPITSDEDPGLYNPMIRMITVTGEIDKYVAGIKIPADIQAGQTCSTCAGFVQEKIKHKEGPEERKLYEWVKNISVQITARRGNHLEGIFSFVVKVKEDGEKEMIVKDGHFKTDLQ
jgi:hypothetical protein